MSAINLSTEKPLYNLVDVDLTEINRYPDSISDIYERKINGIIVRNVFSPEEAAEVVARIEGGEPEFDIRWFGDYVAIYGANALWTCEPELREYCDKTAIFRHNCRKLFTGIADFEQLMKEIFSAMSSGRQIEIPTTASGESYSPMTIRFITEGGCMGLHFGNGLLQHPACQELSKKIKFECHFSYFVVLNAADTGGELVLYDLEWSDTENGMLKDGQPIESVLRKGNQMPINLGVGDMILFDGSRILHNVASVKGSNRITIGGFVALSRDDEKVYYWS